MVWCGVCVCFQWVHTCVHADALACTVCGDQRLVSESEQISLPICCSFWNSAQVHRQGFPAKFSYTLYLVSVLFGALGNPLPLYSQATSVVETIEGSHGVSFYPSVHPFKAVSNITCFLQHMWLYFIKTGIPSVGWEFQLREMTQLSSSSLYILANPIPIISLIAHHEVCPWEQWFLILELL